MEPFNLDLTNLSRHFKYTVEKEIFLNSLSDEDLKFIRDVFCEINIVTENNLTSESLQAKKMEQILSEFESPTFKSKTKNFISSWIWSPPKPSRQRNEIIKKICETFSEAHLSVNPLNLHLSSDPEIGLYEKLFKEPVFTKETIRDYQRNDQKNDLASGRF